MDRQAHPRHDIQEEEAALKKALRDREGRRRKKAAPFYLKAIKWTVGLALVAGVVYFVSQNAGVAFDERAIGVVNFSDLSPAGRKKALRAANDARCSCGCGLGLAECVSTDKTCPIREGNIERIRTMVREASAL
jgi:hypothetical protein